MILHIAVGWKSSLPLLHAASRTSQVGCRHRECHSSRSVLQIAVARLETVYHKRSLCVAPKSLII